MSPRPHAHPRALPLLALLLLTTTPTLAQDPAPRKPGDETPGTPPTTTPTTPPDLANRSFYEPANVGYDGGFFLESADGDFRLEPSAFAQFRYVYTHRPSGPGVDTQRSGFEFRRLKFKVEGHAFSPNLTYRLGTSFDRNGGVNELSDAFLDWRPADHVTLRIGRFRPPLLREEIVSAKKQLLVERSLIRSAFGRDRRLGLAATFHHDTASLQLAAQNAGNDEFGGDSGVYTARAQLALAGKPKQLRDFTSNRDDDFAALLGASALYERDEPTALNADAYDLLQWSADLSLEGRGFNLLAALVGNHLDPNVGAKADQFGIVLQGGYRLTDHTELLARYVWGDADHQAPDLSVLTVGFNHYLHEHNLKFTFDVGYALSEVADFWSSSGAGYLTDAPGERGQLVLRSQIQVVF